MITLLCYIIAHSNFHHYKWHIKTPSMFRNKKHFVTPITRKTYTSAEERSRVDKNDNLFQLDIEDDNSRVELTPGITRVRGR